MNECKEDPVMKGTVRSECILPLVLFIIIFAALFAYPSIFSPTQSDASGSNTDTLIQSGATTTVAGSPVPRSLWVGEENTVIAVTLADGQPGLYIHTKDLEGVAVDNNRSVVWVGTKKAIIQYHFDGNEKLRYSLKHGKQSNTDDDDVVRLSLDPSDGSVWIGAGREIIKLSFDNRELLNMAGFDHIADVSVDISDGSCWVGQKQKISKYSSDGTSLLNFTLEQGNAVHALAADPTSHALWIGTKRGLNKVDGQGAELLHTKGPRNIQDIKINSTTGSVWVITKKNVFKYGKDGQKLFIVPLCAKDPGDDDDEDGEQYQTSGITVRPACTDGDDDHNKDCEGDLVALAVDSIDDICWVASRKTLFKLSDAGALLLRLRGYIQIQALDIGLPKIGVKITEPLEGAVFDTSPLTVKGTITDLTTTVDVNGNKAIVTNLDFEAKNIVLTSGTNTITATATNLARQKATDTVHVTYKPPDNGPTLIVCPEPYGEQRPHPPVPGCAQQVLIGHIHWNRGYVLGQVNSTTNAVVVDGITLIPGGYIYNQGRILSAAWTGSFFWALLVMPGPDGPYPINTVATNNQGKTVSATVTFIKDMVFPNVTITAPPDGTITRDQTIIVTGVVDDPTAVVTDGWTGAIIPVANGAFSYQFNMGSGDGLQYIDVRSTDPAMNQGSAVVTVIRDSTPPQITVTSPADGMITNSQTISIAGTIIDQNPGTITLSLNSGPSQPMTLAGTNFSGSITLVNGSNSLLFTATDRAGNASTLTRTITLDQEPPTTTVTGVQPNTVLIGTATISVTASDTLSGIQSVTLLVDGIVKATLTQGPYTFNLDSFGLSAGSHTITIRVIDKAGNKTEQNIPITTQHQFGIQIISPTTGTIINKSTAIVTGKINLPASQEIGVIVNGTPAEQQGNNFAVIIPLQQGQNTITATATNVYGLQEQASITINTDNAQEPIRFTVSPTSGIPMTKPDGTTSFDTTMNVETYLTTTIASYSYDTNGDGTPDQTGATLTQVMASYQNPGLYFPTITVTDTMGNTYTETTIVNVLDRNAMDALLKVKWEGMKGAVISGNNDAALNYFMPGAQDRYRAIFTNPARNITARLSEITGIEIYSANEKTAQGGAIRLEADGEYAYPLNFVRDEFGIWKILGF